MINLAPLVRAAVNAWLALCVLLAIVLAAPVLLAALAVLIVVAAWAVAGLIPLAAVGAFNKQLRDWCRRHVSKAEAERARLSPGAAS